MHKTTGRRAKKNTHDIERANQQPVELADANEIRTLSVLLVINAVVSFRAAPRILDLLHTQGTLPFSWIPHFTSVINWTLRFGLSLLKEVKPLNRPWVAILDHSIGIGIKKVFVVLRVPLDALSNRGTAIGLNNCECIGLEVTEKTDGETVASALSEIFECAGDQTVILKDGGTDLARGVELWKAQENKDNVFVIDDLGHWVANALKAQFEKSKIFKAFLRIIRTGATRLRQTSLAFLIPPKIRTKGRFMSMSKLGDWASYLLIAMAGRGKAKEASQLCRLRKAMPGFCAFRSFIERFALNVQTMAAVMKILKHKGLNQKTYDQTMDIIEMLPPRSKVKKRLRNYLKKHLDIQCRLEIDQMPLLVSSDVIESLFGKFKHIIERSPVAEINRMALVIPTLCGGVVASKQELGFTQIKHREISEWEKENTATTLRKQRRLFMQDILHLGY